MIWRNTAERYGAGAAGLHWLIAVFVLALLGLGLYMVSLDLSPFKFKLYFWHKSAGVTVLALVAVRLLWRLANIQPLPLAGHKKWEKTLAKIIHFLLYACLLALPLSGWVMSSAKGISVSVFGLFTLPDLVAENEKLGNGAVVFHRTVAYSLIGLLSLHIAGAFKHHFIDRDATLRRMIPGTRLALMIALAGLTVPAWAQDSAPLPVWVIDQEKSAITFQGTQMGAPFTGEFGRFDGTIAFDPARLDESRAEIAVDVTSVTTRSKDRDKYITEPVWLSGESFPESRFVATSFEKTGENQYVAAGDLTIKGVTLPVEMPFTLAIAPDESGREAARMEGSFTVERLAYNVGEGEWKDVSMVGNPVTVRVLLVAAKGDAAKPE